MASETCITEIVEFNPTRTIKRGALSPFVEMAALLENCRDVAYVSEREFSGSGSKFQNGDTLFARITPCLENGKTVKVRSLPEGVVAHGSTEFIVMAPKDREHDEDYIYYLARHPEFRAFAEARMEGTSGRQRVSWQALADFQFPFPPKEQRQNVGEILRTFDDKIHLNRRINQTLEAMAQAIFKSWFVDFNPVKAKIAAIEQGQDPLHAAMRTISGKTDAELDQMPREHHDQLAATAALFPDEMEESELGEIPKGWQPCPLNDLIDLNPPERLSKGTLAPYVDMASLSTVGSWPEPPILREFGSGTKFRNKDTLLARITPCLENGKTAFIQNLPENTVGWGSTEFIVMRPKNNIPPEFAYVLARSESFRSFAIQSMTGTSGRQRAQASVIASYPLIDAGIAVQKEFGKLVCPMFGVVKEKSKESIVLGEVRDTFLPKLLSGELPANLIDAFQEKVNT